MEEIFEGGVVGEGVGGGGLGGGGGGEEGAGGGFADLQGEREASSISYGIGYDYTASVSYLFNRSRM